MKEKFLRDVKDQPNLPRWFSSIFKMIQSPNAGSLIIQLPDNRKFIVESKKPGANAYIVVKNEHFFSRLCARVKMDFQNHIWMVGGIHQTFKQY